MELRSRKLPSPFHPHREDKEDHEHVPRPSPPDIRSQQPDPDMPVCHTAIRGNSQSEPHQPNLDPDDCYIPPSGTIANDPDNDLARCPPDQDLEDMFFSPSGLCDTEEDEREPDQDPDRFSFHPYGMSATGGTNDHNQPQRDHFFPGSVAVTNEANQPFSRPPTPIPMRQPRDMLPVPEEPANPGPSFSTRPIHRPRPVHQSAAASFWPSPSACQDQHTPCMPRPSTSIQTTQGLTSWKFPRSHRVEPNYTETARNGGSDMNRPRPRRPVSPVWRDPNIHCPWRNSPDMPDSRFPGPDFARDRFPDQHFNRPD